MAILKRENGHDRLIARMEDSPGLSTCGISVLQVVLALHRIDGLPIAFAQDAVAAFLKEAAIAIVPIAEAKTEVATSAHARHGKGQGHPAQLNPGDRFSFACARTQDVPLLSSAKISRGPISDPRSPVVQRRAITAAKPAITVAEPRLIRRRALCEV